MKHWTEPNGNFILNIPLDWQCKSEHRKNIYLFSTYSHYGGSIFIYQFPLIEKGFDVNIPIQRSDTRVEWISTAISDKKHNILRFSAQVEDLFLILDYVYPNLLKKNIIIENEIKIVHDILNSIIIIPQSDRILAQKLDKYDNFFSSLCASYDLLNSAFETESYIEMIVIVANQIDAFLRLTIVLKKQIDDKTDDLEVKYLFQAEGDKGLIERNIYNIAFKKLIICENIFSELNYLYDCRNKVIHRYIISHIKTRDIIKIAYKYIILKEKIRIILESYEDKQFGLGYGIYGKHKKIYNLSEDDVKFAFSLINDKHLIKKLEKKL